MKNKLSITKKAWSFTIVKLQVIRLCLLTATMLCIVATIAIIGCSKDDEHTHDWKWVITTPATTETEGVETETCATCGETRGTRPIAKIVFTWTVADISSTFITGNLNSLDYNNGKWFAVGWDYNSDANNRIVSSTDGVNWSVINRNSILEANIHLIVFMGGKWIARGEVENENDNVAFSTDGVSWTKGNIPVFSGTMWSGIQFLGNKFFAAGANGKITYSTDFINWTNVTDSTFGSDPIYRIAYGNGKCVAVGDKGKIAYSTDGISWSAVTNSPATTGIWGITFANGKFVAIEENKHTLYSTDGVNWTAGTDLSSTYTSGNSPSIYYCGNKFIINVENGRIAYSENGTSWDVANISNIFSGSAYGINGICWGNGIFVAYGNNWDGTSNNPKMAYSTNFQEWKEIDISNITGTRSIYGIIYGSGRFVAICSDNIIIYSVKFE